MILVALFLAACFLAYSNGANDNFKGVASLYGCRAANYRTAITWATITTFAGSIASIFLAQALRNGWFWAGVPLMALSFYSLLVLLSWQPISFVIPASALSYVVGTLGAKYILREDVSPARWIGVVLVCAGVALVAAG